MLPGFSLMLSHVEETARGIVGSGQPETHNTTGEAGWASPRDFRIK